MRRCGTQILLGLVSDQNDWLSCRILTNWPEFTCTEFVLMCCTHADICEPCCEQCNIFMAPLCPMPETMDEWGWSFCGTWQKSYRPSSRWNGPASLSYSKKDPTAPPPLPSDSPGRTSVGAPDLCPHPTTYSALSLPPMLSVLLLLHWGDSWGAKVLLLWWRCNATRSWVEARCNLFSRPPAPGVTSNASLWRETGGVGESS